MLKEDRMRIGPSHVAQDPRWFNICPPVHEGGEYGLGLARLSTEFSTLDEQTHTGIQEDSGRRRTSGGGFAVMNSERLGGDLPARPNVAQDLRPHVDGQGRAGRGGHAAGRAAAVQLTEHKLNHKYNVKM